LDQINYVDLEEKMHCGRHTFTTDFSQRNLGPQAPKEIGRQREMRMSILGRWAFMLIGALGWLGACVPAQSTAQQQARQEQQVQTIMGQVQGMILRSSPGW
jgi:hypothetical protein